MVLSQRLLTAALFRADLAAFFAGQGEQLIAHLVPIELLLARPLDAFLYWQASPPLPSLVLALFARITEWPVQVSWLLSLFAGLLDAVAAALLAAIVAEVWSRPRTGAAVALVFGLSPDLVILDYNMRGQSFYENAAMMLVALACYLAWRLLHDPVRLAPAAWLGLATAAAALTRASYSFFSLAFLLMLLVLPMARKGRRLLVFAAVALAVQGGWAVKNGWVYDHFRWSTSTWGGGNLTAGLVNLGYGADLRQIVLDHAADYPPFFVDLVREKVDFAFHYPPADAALPPEIVLAEQAIDQRLLGRNRFQNRIAQRIVFDHLARAWRTLIAQRPELLVRKLKWSYKLYWFPIRYHTGQFFHFSPFECDSRLAPAATPWPLLRAILDGEAPEQVWLNSGAGLERRPVQLPTLDLLNLIAWQANLWLVHLLAFPLAAWLLWKRGRGRAWSEPEAFHLLLAGVFAYAALVHNLVEFGENMRFRLNGESAIWLLSFSALHLAQRLWRGRDAQGDAEVQPPVLPDSKPSSKSGTAASPMQL